MSLLGMINKTNGSHKSFIEANYHISDPLLILERRAMMDESNQEDGISINPRIEASPRYEQTRRLLGQGLPPEVNSILGEFINEGLDVFDTPYTHQLNGLVEFFVNGKDLVVMTGTGSGKTEIFLWSILGHLAKEASRGSTTAMSGIRTILLYPMNALVSDQLGRIRRLVGRTNQNGRSGSEILNQHFDRPPQFMQYTSRAPYHGSYNQTKNENRLRPIFETWTNLQNSPVGSNERNLFERLQRKGRVPEKDLQGFMTANYLTPQGDPELFARHEARDAVSVNGGVPDILVTNYAMLEFMLLRPIEDPFWEQTRNWLNEPESELLLVLDEAHLYRGAVGAEVAMLLRRFMLRLGIDNTNREKVRFILTSASFSSPTAACQFASELTGKPVSSFEAIQPTAAAQFPQLNGTVDDDDVRLLSQIEPVPSFSDVHLQSWITHRGWNPPAAGINENEYIGAEIIKDSLAMDAGRFLENCNNRITTLEDFTEFIFPAANHQNSVDERTSAALNLANLLSVATISGNNVLPLRLHMMLRSLDKQFVCIDPDCSHRRVMPGVDPRATVPHLGRLSVGLPMNGCCDCGSKMYELVTHRDCGASYLKVFVDEKFTWKPNKPPMMLRPEVTYNSKQDGLKECLLLVSSVSQHQTWGGIQNHQLLQCYLEKATGIMHYSIPPNRQPNEFLNTLVPEGSVTLPLGNNGANTQISSNRLRRATWRFCPHCTQENTGLTNTLHGRIQDLQVKGTQPFTNILSVLFEEQPSQPGNTNPNQGRKMIAFSDSRQKSAKLSIDMQDHTETDRFREFYLRIYDRLIRPRGGHENNIGVSFYAFLEYLQSQNVDFYDRDARRDIIQRKETKLNVQPTIGTSTIDPSLLNLTFRPPNEFYASLLNMFGHDTFSLRKLSAGYVTFTDTITQHLETQLNQYIPDRNNLHAVLERIVDAALNTFSLAHIEQTAPPIPGMPPQPVIFFTPEYRPFNPARMARHWWRPDSLSDFIGSPNSRVEAILQNAHDIGAIPDPNSANQIIAQIQTILQSLTVENQMRWLVNLTSLSVIDSTQHTEWYRCSDCKEVSPFRYVVTTGDVCVECHSSNISPVTPSDVCLDYGQGDLLFQSRKRHLLRPALEAVTTDRPIRTLRTEEHSAQISGKEDDDEQYAKTELYEMLFQDIPIGNDKQPVDILSCTTTMEVGIDIGGITAVALRTIPPRPDNYQQRAGRAGRRGTSLSTIISYANNTPHDMYHFRNPEAIIGNSPRDPQIYVTNRVIAERHISASLLEIYIGSIGPLPVQGGLVDSWGNYGQFFAPGPQNQSIHADWNANDLINFFNSLIVSPGNLHQTALQLVSCLPDQMFLTSADMLSWIEAQIRDLVDWYTDRLPAGTHHLDPSLYGKDLMEYLLDEMKLPKFAFPLRTVNFQAEEYRHSFASSNSIQLAYNPSTDGAAALTMYAPDRMITIDKHRMISKGVTFSNLQTWVQHRARRSLNEVNYDETVNDPARPNPTYARPTVEYLNSCNYCLTVSSVRTHDLHGDPCTACNIGHLQSLRYLEPDGFAPEHNSRTRHPSLRDNQNNNRVGLAYSTIPRNKQQRYTMAESRYPLETNIVISPSPIRAGHSIMYSMDNQRLLVVNDGEASEGFEICLDCGRVNPGDGNHTRPYAIRRNLNTPLTSPYPFMNSRCNSPHRDSFALCNSIDSSVIVLHTKMSPPLNLYAGTETPWFKSACDSLVEAVRLASSRALEIEPNELKGGWRFVPQSAFGPGVTPNGVTHFNLEFYFHDTLPGGAGFSTRLEQHRPSGNWGIPDEVRNLLDCTCSTSCTECLRTPDNQMIHESLNRHWALQLLNYLVDEERPQIIPHVRQSFIDELSSVFALYNNGSTFQAVHVAGDEYQLSFNGNTENFHIQSVLAEVPDPDTTISDLDMTQSLRNVIEKISDAL